MKKILFLFTHILFILSIASIALGYEGENNVAETLEFMQEQEHEFKVELEQESYDDFINTVWKFESDIDPAKQSYYNENWNKPIGSYPEVTSPGRVVRSNATGEPIIRENMTEKDFFTAFGIVNMYYPGIPNPNWKAIQSTVTNYLGFVGFQFQESDLHDLGYYDYAMVTVDEKDYPSHYVDVNVSHWENGVRGYLETDLKIVSAPTYVTDTVSFTTGEFTGKDGISDFEDFKDPAKHVLVIKAHFANKYSRIVAQLAARGKKLSDYLGKTVTWNGLIPAVSPPPGGRSNEVTLTMSGLLAGAHLRGAAGVVSLLMDNQNPSDESGTYILQYVQDYAGYQTPFQ